MAKTIEKRDYPVVAHLDAWLRHIEPSIHRRLEVPGEMKLSDLHTVLQVAFGWENCHLHQFESPHVRYVDRASDPDAGRECGDEAAVTVGEVLRELGDDLMYAYDFADGWEHTVALHGISLPEYGVTYPRCTGGARSGPPEDCGGPMGYVHYLEALKNRRHPEHKELMAWRGPFDAERFSQDEINLALRSAFAPVVAKKRATTKKA